MAMRIVFLALAALSIAGGSAAQTKDGPATVVFVCEHGTVKSVVAAALFNKLSADRGLSMRAVARGVSPSGDTPAAVRQGLKADGIALGAVMVQKFEAADATGVKRVVSFDQPVVAAMVGDRLAVEWNALPAFSDGYPAARRAIAARVGELLEQLTSPDLAITTRAFVAAFNARDIDTMLSLAADDVEWINVTGAKLLVETAGKNALRTSMTSSFKSCPTCQSQVEISAVTAVRVAAIETASWKVKDATRTQRSLSVYEFENGRIRRVYYYPVEK